MSEGHLRILFGRPGTGPEAPLGVVARVLSLAEGGEPKVVQTVAPASGSAGRSIAVAPGAYTIQLVLPSGELMQAVHNVGSGETVDVLFEPPESRGGRRAEPSRRSPPTRSSRSLFSLKLPNVRFRRGAPSRVAPESLGVPRLYRMLGDADAADYWDAAFRDAVVRQAAMPIPTDGGPDGLIWTWAFDKEPASSSTWLRVETKAAIELVRAPLPWVTLREEPYMSQVLASVRIEVDGREGHERAATVVAVDDHRMGGLLAYLDKGRLGAVRPLVEGLDQDQLIERLIRDKMLNPFAACAAAFVGLAIFDPSEAERWDSWLPNISMQHPWLPDGAVVHARRVALRPSHDSERATLRHHLRAAYRAGVPYFSAGVELLRDMLQTEARDWPEGREMLTSVAQVANRLDRSQAFTVLRYPRSADAA